MQDDPFSRFKVTENYKNYESCQNSKSFSLKRKLFEPTKNETNKSFETDRFVIEKASQFNTEQNQPFINISEFSMGKSQFENRRQHRIPPNVYLENAKELSNYSYQEVNRLTRLHRSNLTRIVFEDCSVELVSFTQPLTVRCLIDDLLKKKSLNYSSYKVCFINTNEVSQ